MLAVPGVLMTAATADAARPNTVITSGPEGVVRSQNALVSFRSTKSRSRYACSLDGRRWRRCRPPYRIRHLSSGRHRFRVRAIDQAGRVDHTPAKISWRVVLGFPAAPLAPVFPMPLPVVGGAVPPPELPQPTTPAATPSPTPSPAPSPSGVGTSLPVRLPESLGATFYVSPTGSDGNAGTLSAPWRTVQKAFDTLTAGQVALVRAGTYSENVVVRRAGPALAPITVRNYPGERPVLHPSSVSPSYPLRLTTGAAFVRVQGFVIENAQGASTMNVVGLGSNPGAHDYEISDCEIRFAKNSSGVFIDNTNYDVWLLGNTVHDNNEAGVQHQGIYLESDDSVIANNVVYNQTNGFGIQVRTDAPSGPDNVIVADNTVTGVSLSGIMFEHTVSNSKMINNVSAFNAGTGLRGLYSDGDHPNDPVGTGNVAYNNVVYGNGRNLYSDPTPSGATILDFGRGNTTADPLFVNRGAWDLRLQAGSPAIDTGLNAFSPTLDRVFMARPQGATPDVGAYERPF